MAAAHQLNTSGNKIALIEAVIAKTGLSPFAARLQESGVFFEVTPAGLAEATKFAKRRKLIEAAQRHALVNAWIQRDLAGAAKTARGLLLLNAPGAVCRSAELDVKQFAEARAVRFGKIPKSAVLPPGTEDRCQSIAASFVLCGCDDWAAWDVTFVPPKNGRGKPIGLLEFARALAGFWI
jgi:hypothetical protein